MREGGRKGRKEGVRKRVVEGGGGEKEISNLLSSSIMVICVTLFVPRAAPLLDISKNTGSLSDRNTTSFPSTNESCSIGICICHKSVFVRLLNVKLKEEML